jgi:nitrate/nitrite transporter NarK
MRTAAGKLGTAIAALVAIPVIYIAAMQYGAEYLVWDAAHATYTYVERPGGLAVIITALVVCAALAVTAVVTSAAGATQLVRAQRRRLAA